MENRIPDQSVFEAMIEEIAGKSVNGRAFTISVKTPERKQCYEELKAAKILSDVPQLPDPKTQGIVAKPVRLEVKAKAHAQENVLVHAVEGWREKWEKYKKDNFGIYDLQT